MAYIQIVGGQLRIHKKVFIQEMLVRESKLRTLLSWKSAKDFAKEHPMVGETDEQGMVTIDFSGMPSVEIGDSPKEILGELKAKYKEKIKGKVICKGGFTGIYSFEIDLNSDGDNIEYIME